MENQNRIYFFAGWTLTLLTTVWTGLNAQQKMAASTRNDSAAVPLEGKSKNAALTYNSDVAPIVKKYCLPCHLAEDENSSGLSLDNYELMQKGGEHGLPVVAGKPEKSNFYLKLLPNPLFGKQMPRGKKKLSPEEIKVIYDWIAQGAKR